TLFAFRLSLFASVLAIRASAFVLCAWCQGSFRSMNCLEWVLPSDLWRIAKSDAHSCAGVQQLRAPPTPQAVGCHCRGQPDLLLRSGAPPAASGTPPSR